MPVSSLEMHVLSPRWMHDGNVQRPVKQATPSTNALLDFFSFLSLLALAFLLQILKACKHNFELSGRSSLAPFHIAQASFRLFQQISAK